MAVTKSTTNGLLGTKTSHLAPVVAAPPAGWVRPSDWLALPSVVAGDQKFVGLVAVWPSDSNWIAVTFNGNYTVNWGDGTAPVNVSAGVATNHNYTYASVAGTDCSRGYRQAIVTVTPQSGQNLTVVNLPSTRPTGMVSGWSSAWLDIRLAGASVTVLTVSNNTTPAAMLERFEYVGSSAITTSAPGFQGSSSLESVIGTAWTSAVTNFSFMFYTCTALQTIPLLATSAGTNFSSMFYTCTALRTIPLLDTSAGTNFSTMFNVCTALQTIPLLNTSAGTNFSSMFSGCTALQTIPLLNTSAGTNFISMFFGCSALQAVAALNTAAGTDFTTMFNGCKSLQSAPLAGTSKTISYASCKLKGAALDAIYTALASGVTAQTITVTSNWDVANDTTSIATGKGWTVTG